MTTTTKVLNRLAKEESPYLLLHAYNPVDWYPLGKVTASVYSLSRAKIFSFTVL